MNCHTPAIFHTFFSGDGAHLVVNVLGVQAVLINSVTFHVLLVLGADDHDDEHRFLQDEAAAFF